MSDRKLVIFDFDGTLVDSHTSYVEALKEFSDARGLPHCGQKMAAGYTNPAQNDLGWDLKLEQQEKVLQELNAFYYSEVTKHQRFMPVAFPKTNKILGELNSLYDLAIITARNRKSLEAVLDFYQWTDYFPIRRTLCCAQEKGYQIKPAPDALHCLVQETKHTADDCIVIGDTIADIEMANAAGAKSIAALWGRTSGRPFARGKADSFAKGYG